MNLTTNSGATIALSSLEHLTTEEGAPIVYFTSKITPSALIDIYKVLDFHPTGKIGIKMSTGEPPASNYLRPALIGELVQMLGGTIVECNTAYDGQRRSTDPHLEVIKDHGFYDIADVQIQDADGDMTLPIAGGQVIHENYVGAAFADYGSYLALSHFKGHIMAGFGGAVKNISIGFASSEGKMHIHSGGTGWENIWTASQHVFCGAMADAAKSVSDYLDGGARITYINVMNRLSIDCDCDGHPHEPEIADIGILSSHDPVALDQACIDLVWNSEGRQSFVERVEKQQGLYTLEAAEKIGLGSRNYRLEIID